MSLCRPYRAFIMITRHCFQGLRRVRLTPGYGILPLWGNDNATSLQDAHSRYSLFFFSSRSSNRLSVSLIWAISFCVCPNRYIKASIIPKPMIANGKAIEPAIIKCSPVNFVRKIRLYCYRPQRTQHCHCPEGTQC